MSTNDSIETSASTVEEAIKNALESLGATEDDVAIEVLATPRAGVLGLGARQARVRVTRRPQLAATSGVQAPPPAPPLRQERSGGQPREQRPPRQAPPPERPRPQRQAQERSPVAPRPAAAPEAVEAEPAEGNRQPADLVQQGKEAHEILAGILERMGEKAELRQLDADSESIEIEIKGDGSGILIGRHGQTLDALEYVVNRILARRIKDAVPISLETESYRARRRQQLHRMALSMGEKAKREHTSVRLEPMPPRDRRAVHLALKDDPMLSTRSAGEGFLRAIEIVPAEGNRQPRERERERDRGNEGRGRRRERGNNEPRGNESRANESRSNEPHGNEPREPRNNEPRKDERGNSSNIGEQGGFKHGQKRLF
jgi:spoIIIJ-associated protein